MKISFSAILVAGLACLFLLDTTEASSIKVDIPDLVFRLEVMVHSHKTSVSVKNLAKNILVLLERLPISGVLVLDLDLVVSFGNSLLTSLDIFGVYDEDVNNVIVLLQNLLNNLHYLVEHVGPIGPVVVRGQISVLSTVSQLVVAVQVLLKRAFIVSLSGLLNQLLSILSMIVVVVLSTIIRAGSLQVVLPTLTGIIGSLTIGFGK